MSALLIEIIFLLDGIQLIIFVGTLTHLEPELFVLIIFYSFTFLIIKTVLALRENVCIYIRIFFQSLTAGMTALFELLLSTQFKLPCLIYGLLSK